MRINKLTAGRVIAHGVPRIQFVTLQNKALRYPETHATPARPWGLVADTRRMGATPAEAPAQPVKDFHPRARASWPTRGERGARQRGPEPAECPLAGLP